MWREATAVASMSRFESNLEAAIELEMLDSSSAAAGEYQYLAAQHAHSTSPHRLPSDENKAKRSTQHTHGDSGG